MFAIYSSISNTLFAHSANDKIVGPSRIPGTHIVARKTSLLIAWTSVLNFASRFQNWAKGMNAVYLVNIQILPLLIPSRACEVELPDYL